MALWELLPYQLPMCALFLGCTYLQTFVAKPHKCVSLKIVLTSSNVL